MESILTAMVSKIVELLKDVFSETKTEYQGKGVGYKQQWSTQKLIKSMDKVKHFMGYLV